MGFTQKGFSSHTGTSGHKSALKAHVAGHKPEMSKVTKHGNMSDAKADFKADQDAYKKAMADKPTTQKVDPDAPGTPGTPGYEPEVKSMDYLTKTPVGPVVDKEAPPTKFLGLGDKEGRAKRKTMRKDAKTKRKASKKVTKSENKTIKSDAKTAKLASKLNKRQVKAETNVTEKKENKAKKGSKFKGNINDGIKKVNKFLYGDKGKAETGGTNAEIAKNDKSGKRAIRNYKVNRALHNLNEGEQAFTKGRRMKEFDGEDPRNKLASKQNQNKGIKSGNESKSKTSKAASMKTDGKYDTVKQNMAKTQTKMDNKAADKKSKKTKKSLESNPLYKQNKGVKKGGGSYDKYFG